MTRDGTSRRCSRLFVALLAAWMAVFAVVAAVHNHDLTGPFAKRASLEQPGAGELKVGSCYACLASHVPVPAPGGQIVLPAPQQAAEMLSAPLLQSVNARSNRSWSSRAPPALLVFAS